MSDERKPYPSDVTNEEWIFYLPYLTLMKADAPPRQNSLRELFNGLRWLTRTGSESRMMPHDLPPWHAVYQQTRRWLRAGCFEAVADDLRVLLRVLAGRNDTPSAVIVDSRTIQSTPERGGRGGYNGAKNRKGSKVHAAVDTLGHLLALKVTAANEQDREQVGELTQAVQQATGQQVELAYVDAGYTGGRAAAAAKEHGIRLELVGMDMLPVNSSAIRTIGFEDGTLTVAFHTSGTYYHHGVSNELFARFRRSGSKSAS